MRECRSAAPCIPDVRAVPTRCLGMADPFSPRGKVSTQAGLLHFTESQIIGMLKELDAGATAVEVARSYGVHPYTLGRWRSKREPSCAAISYALNALTSANFCGPHLPNGLVSLCLWTRRILTRLDGHRRPRSWCGCLSWRWSWRWYWCWRWRG
jgi:hypothetical protein